MKKIIGFAIVSVLFSTISHAYSLDCSSANSKIQYRYKRNDGGAAMSPIELLRVNGQDIINVSIPGGAQLRLGKIELSKKTVIPTGVSKPSPAPRGESYKTTYSNAMAKVSNNNGNLIIESLVHCKEVIYTGVARP